MSQKKDEEPLFPPWVASIGLKLGPLAVLILLWWLLTMKFHVSGRVLLPFTAVLVLFGLVYFGGRFYKPFRVEKKTGKCLARTKQEREGCRHFIAGAKLGGGCGRLREDRRCRYVKG